MAEKPESVVNRCEEETNPHGQQHHQSLYSNVFFKYLDDNNLANQNKEELSHQNDDDQDNISNSANDFWANQQQILLNVIRRSSRLETEIRKISKEVVKKEESETRLCGCGRALLQAADCRNCLLKQVSIGLRNEGYNSAVCNSRWRCSGDFPAGEHRFVDVVESIGESKRRKEVRVMVEVGLRSEFDMGVGSEEYKRLVEVVPEVYVGKVEKLEMVIDVMCAAAKMCVWQKKMHLAPWRKHRYMRTKWLGPCIRDTPSSSSIPLILIPRSIAATAARRASLLTVDLLDDMVADTTGSSNSNMHCTNNKPLTVG